MPVGQAVALSGLQKSALLLIQIGKDRAARVMQEMSDEEVELLSAEIMRMSNVPREISADIIDEFYENTMAMSAVRLGSGGMDYAQKVLEQTFGKEKAAEIMEKLMQGMQGQPFDFLKSADPREIVTLIQPEHPQTIALILAHLRPDHAARVMAGLGPKLQGEVAVRIAQLERANPEMVSLVASALQKKAEQVINNEEMQAVGGVEPLVDIINRADPGTEKMILTGLEERDEELADEVRSRMFVFEDIIKIDERGIRELLKEISNEDLTMALKTAAEDLRQKFFKNLSERAANMIREDLAIMGPVKLSDVETAQQNIVKQVRRLEAEGRIIIAGSGGDVLV